MNKTAAAILLALAAGGCRPSPPAPDAPTSTLPAVEGQVLRRFELQDIREGRKTMVLIADEAKLHEETHTADVDKPRIVFYKEGQPTSRLTAPQGRVDTSTHDIEAWGDVYVVTSDSATLETERLRYDSGSRRLLSDNPVKLTRPGSVTYGEGLESDPELKRVKILRQRAVLEGRKS